MPVFARASRQYRFVPGRGGGIRVRQYDLEGQIVGGDGDAVYFDVAQYLIKHITINEETPHSGMNGGTDRTQVAHDWSFAANVSFPGQVLGGGVLAAGFAEQILGSPLGVDVRFNIGDPEWWTLRGLEPRSYHGPALLAPTEVDSTDGNTVKINVTGEGKGLLWLEVLGAGGNWGAVYPNLG